MVGVPLQSSEADGVGRLIESCSTAAYHPCGDGFVIGRVLAIDGTCTVAASGKGFGVQCRRGGRLRCGDGQYVFCRSMVAAERIGLSVYFLCTKRNASGFDLRPADIGDEYGYAAQRERGDLIHL